MEIVGDLEGILLEESCKTKSASSGEPYDAKICESIWFFHEDTSRPDSAVFLIAQADHCYYQKRWQEAIRLFLEARQLLGDRSPLFQRITLESISRCYLGLEDHQSAHLWAQKLLEFNQSCEHKVVAHNLLATICHKQHNFTEEADHLRFCLARQPLNGVHWFHLGQCYLTKASGRDSDPSRPLRTGQEVLPCVHLENGSNENKCPSGYHHKHFTDRVGGCAGSIDPSCDSSHLNDRTRHPKCEPGSVRTKSRIMEGPETGVRKRTLSSDQDPHMPSTTGNCQLERISLEECERMQGARESVEVADKLQCSKNSLAEEAFATRSHLEMSSFRDCQSGGTSLESVEKCRDGSLLPEERLRRLGVPMGTSVTYQNHDQVICDGLSQDGEGIVVAMVKSEGTTGASCGSTSQECVSMPPNEAVVGRALKAPGHDRRTLAPGATDWSPNGAETSGEGTQQEGLSPEGTGCVNDVDRIACTADGSGGVSIIRDQCRGGRSGATDAGSDGDTDISCTDEGRRASQERSNSTDCEDVILLGHDHYRYTLICYIRAKILLKPISSLCNPRHHTVLMEVDEHLKSLGFSEEFVSSVSQHCWKRQFGIDPKQGINRGALTDGVVADGEYIEDNFERYWFDGILEQMGSQTG